MKIRFAIIGIIISQFFAFSAIAETREYKLIIKDQKITIGGKTINGMSINDSVPAPTLNFKEGDDAVIIVENQSSETTSLHWHGLLVPAEMDGVPGLNYFGGIKPNESFTYKFKIRQSGTYWYHSHSGGQEARGLYGALLISPKDETTPKPNREYTLLLSDFSNESPMEITNNLKVNAGHYNDHKRTLGDFVRDAKKFGFNATLEDRKAWGKMRMDSTDLADVSGYEFLINGKNIPQSFEAQKGEKVKLRVINGSAMTFFDLRIPDLKMKVIAADGRDIEPVIVDELRIAVAETYDIEFIPTDDKAYQLIAESMDRRGLINAIFSPNKNYSPPPLPKLRPPPILTMYDMGMGGMDMSMMDHSKMSDEDMAQMHAAMGHSMDHGALLGNDGGKDGSGRPYGWGINADDGEKTLSYADLASLKPQKDVREAEREIIVRLGGNMEKYIWTINGKSGMNIPPIQLKYGERVKLIFVNETMMAHPMHLHGMFVQLNNGQEMEKMPDKHIVVVEPGQTYSVYLTADEIGEWSFHCHLLNHMVGGMMTSLVVAKYDGDAPPMHQHQNNKMQHETLLQHKYEFEWLNHNGDNSLETDFKLGGDFNKLRIRTLTENGETDAQIYYSRLVSDFWDFQIGAGRNFETKQNYAAIGFQGMMPYFIETDAHLILGDNLANLESDFETRLLLTQKLFVEPKASFEYALSDNTLYKSGLNKTEYGVSFGYKATRKMTPFLQYKIENEYNRKDGMNGQNDQLAIGMRVWF